MNGFTVGEKFRHRSAFVSLLAAGFLLAYLIVVSPHLVHHLLEEGDGQATCPLLIQSQQSTAQGQSDFPSVGPPALAGLLSDHAPTAFLPAPIAPTSQPRAPPNPLLCVQIIHT